MDDLDNILATYGSVAEYNRVNNEDDYSNGLSLYVRNIIQYELENSPVEGPVDPSDKPNEPEIHKRIDALRADESGNAFPVRQYGARLQHLPDALRDADS